MFRGIHLLSIDAKGRIKIPTCHQEQIDKACSGRIKIPTCHQEQIDKACSGQMVLSVHPDDDCLVLYPLTDWQNLERKVSKLPSLNVHSKRLSRKLIGHASECDLDKIGRILIPSSHRNYADLKSKAILSGQGHSFEIWDEQSWKTQIEKLEKLSTQVEIPEEILKLSL